MKLAYWIHGEAGSGKSQLARQIAGPDAVVIEGRSTQAAIERALDGAKAVIFEEVHEEVAPDISFLDGKTFSKGSMSGTEVNSVRIEVDVMVYVSESPPKDPGLIRRLHVVKIKDGSRQNV
jgi:hypothetical protein